MIGALAYGCRAARKSAGATPARIAAEAEVSERVIQAFERGETWPVKVEAIVAAYARVVVKEAWELWEEAAETFHG
jgi:DNA-binding XRE family transcriptional regulator